MDHSNFLFTEVIGLLIHICRWISFIRLFIRLSILSLACVEKDRRVWGRGYSLVVKRGIRVLPYRHTLHYGTINGQTQHNLSGS